MLQGGCKIAGIIAVYRITTKTLVGKGLYIWRNSERFGSISNGEG